LAKTKYESFINKYPAHELNSNASLLLSQLGQSDTDLLKQFKIDNKQR
jgi:TolA-binding protein